MADVVVMKGRPTAVSEDQRTAQQWTVRANGVDLKTLKSGESVEIGRKPLRPLPDDGLTRLNVVDINKSMSKRHAVFTVKEQGRAFIRDLNSTNGSYMVTENGQLIKMPTGRDIELPKSPMIVQFGDVKVTFERTDVSARAASEHAPAVSNLFEYADSEEKAPEPDLSDMSVDDILNLRSGEPTTLFRARNVAERVDSMKRAEEHSFAPETRTDAPEADELPSVSLVPSNDVAEEKPRDLFKDAAAKAAENATQQTSGDVSARSDESEPAEQSSGGSQSDTNGMVPVGKLFGAPASSPASVVLMPQSTSVSQPVASAPAHQPQAVESAEGVVSEDLAHRDASSKSVFAQNAPSEDVAADAASANAVPEENPPESISRVEASSEAAGYADSDGNERFRPHGEATVPTNETQTADITATITPIFQPGSVFDRVSKGGLAKQEQTIEVDGMTSDDAKRTDDFTVQFQMARHPELLPFLAMNTMLYDDLYAWLEALGDPDIDAALSRNAGYAEYRKATGK